MPYAAPPLSCAAFFFKVQNGCATRVNSGTEKGVRESVPPPLRLFLCPKGEDSHHQFCLQPFPNVVVYAEIDVPALVVQLPHGEAGYVAAKMLQDNLHGVRVTLCRCHNDRIGNKGIDAHRELHRHKAREVTFSDLPLDEARQLHTFDEYFKGEIAFERAGKKITPKLLLEAIRTLPEEKRKAVLLYYFEGMNDTEIAELFDTSRSTIQYRRTSSFELLKKYLEENADEWDEW